MVLLCCTMYQYFMPFHCQITFSSISSGQFSHSVVSDSLQPHGLQHTRPPCPSPTPGAYSNSCPFTFIDIPYFSHPFSHWWAFGLFPLLVLMNNAAVNIFLQVENVDFFVQTCFTSFEYLCRRGVSGSCSNSMLIGWEPTMLLSVEFVHLFCSKHSYVHFLTRYIPSDLREWP